MNAESAGQDPDVSQRSFVRLSPLPDNEINQRQIDGYNDTYPDAYSFAMGKYTAPRNPSPTNLTTTPSNPSRNKRKNFNPRYNTSTSPMIAEQNRYTTDASEALNPSTVCDDDPAALNERMASSSSSAETSGVPNWLSQYEDVLRAAGLAQHQVSSGSSYHEALNRAIAMQKVAVSDMSDWVRKFGSNESAVSAIRDLLTAYQGRATRDAFVQQDGNGSVNLSTETEPPTPPTTPHTCNNTTTRSIIPNGSDSGHETPSWSIGNSHIKEEIIVQSSSPPQPPPPVHAEMTVYPTEKSDLSESQSQPLATNDRWSHDSVTGDWRHSQVKEKKKGSSEDETPEQFNNYHDDSSDCCDRQQATSVGSPSQPHNMRQWCDEFQKNPKPFEKRIKSECDDTDTTTVGGDTDNNPYDEDDEDYPASPNDFPDSVNEEDEDDDISFSHMFYDYEQTLAATTGGQVRRTYNSEGDRMAMEGGEVYERQSLVFGEKGSCSNSSSKISVRNLGTFFEPSPLNSIASTFRAGIDEGSGRSEYNQNISKFNSYLECRNVMCRVEHLREHYHCYDFPCCAKILCKKEEVIRHVKWHRKRVESLNQGFLRFSSSDDCSTIFGITCQHNQKQTHYHCFQPNCDRIYISTSDVQMHSNFHRKDSAIHKEGFQRFRATEKCNADYCMFAAQKTTHFHCRRDNCRYTFKNKADMEKHKTYHIKDLKLARDGFKKFLKNEPCPYKQCRFSKVCNHIHCARENCFYVLHSSGQLLSHKRKHERMDNEQTYCRYKMLAVKAALMGNPSAAVSPDTAPYNLTNSLLQLRELEISAFIPRASSEPSLLSPLKQELHNKVESVKSSPSPSSVSMEFLQQMKKRHEELLMQKQHVPLDPSSSTTVGAEVSLFPVIQPTGSPQHQYNMALDPTHLTPSIIKQFFTSDCPLRVQENNEPINLKNHLLSNDEKLPKVQKSPSCRWQERSEPHLHCVVKECGAVIPNNVLDISSHIRMHGYNRDVYATTAAAAAAEPPLSSGGTASSNNPMQITTIDGFFNRKRGRPPKNRFVEVYKNAQQSPQAIFTSFKLEKQTTSKDDATPSPSYPQPVSVDPTKETKEILPMHSPQVQNPTASQFTTYKANEHCGAPGGHCSLAMQHHYHCACSPDCNFITVERDLLSVHLERQHTAPSFADTISKKFLRFDRNIGLDCGISECRLRKTRPHLHCRQCFRQISPFDLETHVCTNLEVQPTPLSPKTKLSTFYSSPEYRQTEFSGENFTIHSGKHLLKDYSRLPSSVTFSSLTELRRKVSEMEPDSGPLSKRTHEDERVLVVRAAGTYFPENTTETSSGTSSQSTLQQKTSTSATAMESMQVPLTPANLAYCSTPYCKMKRKPHEHCEFCDQSFVDSAKSKAHRLKHAASAGNKPMSAHLLHCSETSEENKPTNYLQPPSALSNPINPTAYDEQPQDLSLSPNTISAAQDDRFNPNREPPTAPAAPVSSVPGHFPNLFPPDLMSLSMQNFHLAQLATLYQQNPYYHQQLYPFFNNAAVRLTRHQQHRQAQAQAQAQTYGVSTSSEDKPYLPTVTECPSKPPPGIPPSATGPAHFPFLNPLLLARTAETAVPQPPPPIAVAPSGSTSSSQPVGPSKSLKRKLANSGDDFVGAFIDALSPLTKKQMQFAAGLAAAAAAAAGTTGSSTGSGRSGGGSATSYHDHGGQHFKIKDEQIPTGYLKFRFNEDCYFPKCGYRNHQSHFHCDRNDCHYSFCDKTRFVQHTARHERLDKLMGNDFRQYRANMNCGYENCPYFKNLGSANKSSHFHCLKCDFICSDTNKVVAHRRQHSKMEYIRMAGFRKVTNSEKCNSTFEATVPTNGNEPPGSIECSYSQKQTHYHCLVCDVSVLSRAQLASHKHKN